MVKVSAQVVSAAWHRHKTFTALSRTDVLSSIDITCSNRKLSRRLGGFARGEHHIAACLGACPNPPCQYKLFIYTLAGTLQGSFSPTEEPGFGIRCVSWHPTGAYLAVGGWDDKVDKSSRGSKVP